MDRLKIIIASAVFLTLTVFKLLVPGAAADLRREAAEIVGRDTDYTQVMESINSMLTVFKEEETGVPAATLSHTAVRRELQSPVELQSTVKPELASVSGEDMRLPEIPQAVQVFLESQKAFREYAVPDNVSYDYEAFPFEFAVPVSGYESSGFGYRLHPIHGTVKFHYGTDVAANTGEAIHAFAAGTVTHSGYSDSYGYYITIDHGEGWESLYAHCSTLCVQQGMAVKAGERIALVGATGQVTGPHLHFELQREGVYVNPEYYVNRL